MGIPATGNRVEMNIIDVLQVEDGKITAHWANADMMGLMDAAVGCDSGSGIGIRIRTATVTVSGRLLYEGRPLWLRDTSHGRPTASSF